MGIETIENVLLAFEGTVAIVDSEKEIVVKAYRDGKIFAAGIDYDSFCKLVFERDGLCLEHDTTNYTNLYKNLADNSNGLLVPLKKLNGEVENFVIRRSKVDNYYICFYKSASQEKNVISVIDPLTGVYQKNYLLDILDGDFKKKTEKDFFLILLDVDDFKSINDSYGHLFGDKVLRLIAEMLKKNFPNSIISRFGGDEFFICVYSKTDYDTVWSLLHHFYQEMENVRKNNINFSSVSVTCGVSRYKVDGNDFDTLFTKTDKALYRGKRKGKSCFIIYNDEKHKNINLDLIKREDSLDRAPLDASQATLLSKVFDLLNVDSNLEKNILNVFKYLSNYYSIDRISYYKASDSGTTFKYELGYQTPGANNDRDIIYKKDINNNDYQCYERVDGVVIMKKTSNIEESNPLMYEILKEENTKALVRYTLKFRGVLLGYIRVDDCHSFVRMWKMQNIEVFKNIVNLISTILYKIDENDINENKIRKDNLTGLLNGHYFLIEGDYYLTKNPKIMACYYFDFRHFKFINDNYGFQIGDLVLKSMADTLKKVFDKDSLISRISPDRFMVLAPYTSKEDMENKFKVISSKFETFNYAKNYFLTVKIDCGVYITDGTENTISVCFDNANLARKVADENPGSNLVVFSKAIFDRFHLTHELENHFEEALLTKEIELFLQPKINMRTNQIVGAEALSRWKFKGEYINPSVFIPILEHNGSITDLDFYMFEQTCIFHKRMMELGANPIPISVNMSKFQTRLEEYVLKIETIRRKYQIPASLFEIEIVESMFVKNKDLMLDTIHKLEGFGYKIAVDDFGTGYSNLVILGLAHFDTIKIDQSLVGDIHDERRTILLESVMMLASKLHSNVLCEGIETKEQAQHLLSLGCEIAQGFLYDSAISTDEFINKYMVSNKGDK